MSVCGDQGVLGEKRVAVPCQACRAQAEKAVSDTTALHRSEVSGAAWPRGPAGRTSCAREGDSVASGPLSPRAPHSLPSAPLPLLSP